MNMHLERLQKVRSRIDSACRERGRDPASVQLLAVSKQQDANAIRALHALGQVDFGENRLQEAVEKQSILKDLDLFWHFIGPVQSNKTRDIAAHFDWVQSVDREKILRRLNEQRPAHLPPLNICLQVNIDHEPQKAGAPVRQVAALARSASECPRLRLRGLMCIPALTEDEARTRGSFDALVALARSLRKDGHRLDTLSMGMSGDLELAVACGSTLVRVGTDLFGPRQARA